MRKVIPTNVCLLTGVAADCPARHSLQGIHVKLGDTEYLAEATDGHAMIRVEGSYPAPASEFPASGIPTLDGDIAREAVIPSTAWQAISKAKMGREPRPALACISLSISTKEAALVRTNLDRVVVERTRLLDGRFPDTNAILKSAAENLTPGPSVFESQLFARVMSILSKLGAKTVDFGILATNRPLTIKAVNESRQRITALIMSCAVESQRE